MVQDSFRPGQKSPRSVIYRCTACGGMHACLEGETLSVCEVCAEAGAEHEWQATSKEILIVTRDVEREMDSKRTRIDRMSDAVTGFCGHINFVYLHLAWFGTWVIWNLAVPEPFDPFPFGLLTMVVSLEAILLATFILMSQNRQGRITEMRSRLDYQVDLKSEKNTALIMAMLKRVDERLGRK